MTVADQASPVVSVAIPSRKRPETLLRAIRSLQSGTRQPFEIIVGLDEDDPTVAALPELPGVRYILGPRPRTLGQLQNKLMAQASGQWLMGFTDDCVLGDAGDWIVRIEDAGQGLPHQIGVLYLRDELHRHFPTFPVISRRTYDATGYYVTEIFPFWFTDTWWSEIAEFLGRKIEVDVPVISPGGKGKTHGLRDIAFWAEVFEATRPRRMHDAIELMKIAHGEYSVMTLGLIGLLPRVQELCMRHVAHLRDPDFISRWEQQTDSPPGPHYAEVKRYAETLVAQFQAGR